MARDAMAIAADFLNMTFPPYYRVDIIIIGHERPFWPDLRYCSKSDPQSGIADGEWQSRLFGPNGHVWSTHYSDSGISSLWRQSRRFSAVLAMSGLLLAAGTKRLAGFDRNGHITGLMQQSEPGVQGTGLALRVPLAGRCTKYWQMRRSPRRHCSTAGWPVASQKKAARARQTQGSVCTALATGQL